MENETENIQPPKAPKSKGTEEPKITLGMSELSSIIREAVKAAVETSSVESAKIIADAMKESRKPYVDPKQIANEEMMRQQMRATRQRLAENIKLSQSDCEHFQGSNEASDFVGQLSSIVKHRLDNGVVWGICTNCLREFWPTDVDYRKQMSRKSGNRPSQAGIRWFADPAAAAAVR